METEEKHEEAPEEAPEEARVPYERLEQENKAKKAAEQRARTMEKKIEDLKAQMEEREQAGMPELDQLKKGLERAEQRAQEAEERAERADAQVKRSRSESWVTAAAQAQGFADPTDAAAFLNLDEVEDEKDAERAVKRLAGQKKHLLKTEEPVLPGQVLANGQRPEPQTDQGLADANVLADGLRQFASKK